MSDSREMIEIKLGLWALGRTFDTTILSDHLFEKSIATLHELWQRFCIENDKQAEVPEREERR